MHTHKQKMSILHGFVLSCRPERDFLAVVLIKHKVNNVSLLFFFFYELFSMACFDSEKIVKELILYTIYQTLRPTNLFFSGAGRY